MTLTSVPQKERGELERSVLATPDPMGQPLLSVFESSAPTRCNIRKESIRKRLGDRESPDSRRQRHLVCLQSRKHLASESLDLLHEELFRHCPPVERHE